MKLETIKTFDNPINAHILKTRLESEGIECYLFDENISTLNPLFNISVGGIKLNIKNTDRDKAQAIIQEIEGNDLLDEEDHTIYCPKCNSKHLYAGFKSMKDFKGIMSAIIAFVFMVFPIYFKTVYRCKDCGFEF